MRIKYIETKQEIEQVTHMKASSDDQNQFLVEQLENHTIDLDQVMIAVLHNKVVARALCMKHGMYLLTFEDEIQRDDAVCFLQTCVSKVEQKEIELHLYSDKQNYQFTFDALISAGFDEQQEKYSYTLHPTINSHTLLAYPCSNHNKQTWVDAFIRVGSNHLDVSMQRDIDRYGIKRASEILYEVLLVNQPDEAAWLCAQVDGHCVGFVIVSQLTRTQAGISYIGVFPEYRGKHYATMLLLIASNYCVEHGYDLLIADTDIHNIPMQHALKYANFTYSCKEVVLVYNED